ncbi:Hypothetical predicted protein [Pelobates cultripes]|uniref:Uncharacterized protein n=1 Tax=Pelobates cultripes TaxID=61616 RepID=A0AAD1WHJ1_PELCU|nr:Hypothetical predicted protein [Pelobates cultripes]
MSHHKSRKSTVKAERLNFFGQKNIFATRSYVFQDCNDGSDAATSTPDIEGPLVTEPVTQGYLTQALDALSTKLIASWQSSLNTLRQNTQELGSRTSHVKNKLDEFVTTHNDLASHLEYLEQKLTIMQSKLMDNEDRACRNNLRLWGVRQGGCTLYPRQGIKLSGYTTLLECY